jgi:hypothetical protein
VLALYREKYFDFNVRHFHEKLREHHGIALSYSWVKLALQGAQTRTGPRNLDSYCDDGAKASDQESRDLGGTRWSCKASWSVLRRPN